MKLRSIILFPSQGRNPSIILGVGLDAVDAAILGGGELCRRLGTDQGGVDALFGLQITNGNEPGVTDGADTRGEAS